jgi:hypothetical protein
LTRVLESMEIKKELVSEFLFLSVAGTRLERASAAADMARRAKV